MPEPTRTTEILDGCSIEVLRGGAGAPLVYLHGANGLGGWLPVLDALAAHFDVIAPEHPGFGASETPDWLETVADLANFYLDFLDARDLKSVHLVGHSMGGWIAAELAVRNAERLASLTLIDAAGIHVEGVPQMDLFLGTDEERIRALYADPVIAEEMVRRAGAPELEDVTLKNRYTAARLVWQPRLYDPHLAKWLHRIRIPTLILWGDSDPVFPEAYADAFARLIPGARKVVFAGCGHAPTVEKKDALVAEIAGFAGGLHK